MFTITGNNSILDDVTTLEILVSQLVGTGDSQFLVKHN